jgi:hypothetical protein
MHMAQILASVTGDVLNRISPELRQPMFDLLCATALRSAEHVMSSHPESVKRQVRQLTYIYVMEALKKVAAEFNLTIETNAPAV